MASNLIQNTGIKTTLITTGDVNALGVIDGKWNFNSAIGLSGNYGLPGQVLTSTGGGTPVWGVNAIIGEVKISAKTPTGNWLQTGKYYSKTTEPNLSTALGSIADFNSISPPKNNIPVPFTPLQTNGKTFLTATNGTVIVAVSQSGAIKVSTNGLTWSNIAYYAQNFGLSELKYLNNLFIAVGSGTILTSPDGYTWSNRIVTGTLSYTTVAYGSGKYVLCGSTLASVLYSSDAITWTPAVWASPILSSSFNKIIFANGIFVAVGAGVLATSPDGITWTPRTLPANTTIYDIMYANNLFVAVGYISVGNLVTVVTSLDGITWAAVLNTGAGALYSIAYNSTNMFVAVGGASSTSSIIYSSPDGVTWTARSNNNIYSDLYHVIWNGSVFFAVGALGIYATSSDGISWTYNCDISMSTFRSVTTFKGLTIALGVPTTVLLSGATRTELFNSESIWPLTPSTANFFQKAITYGATNYVATFPNGVLLYSSDGLSWIPTLATGWGGNLNWDRVTYLNTTFFNFGASSNILRYSADGVTWSTVNLPATITATAMAYGASTYVIVGNVAPMSSTDTITWTSRTGSTSLNDIVFASSLFVAVGNSGVITTSPDGITWTTRTSNAGTNILYKIVNSGTLFVAVGAAGIITTSPDGITWTARTSGVSAQLNNIVWNGSLFVIVGASTTILTSPDGVTWTIRNQSYYDSTLTLTNIVWTGTKFIASCSNKGYFISSTDGISWTKVSGGNISTTGTFSLNYVNNKILALTTGGIQSSTDGINWSNSLYNYWVGGVNKIYKLNGLYFVCGKYGLYQSYDGITFSVLKSLPANGSFVAMAYGNNTYGVVIQGNAGSPTAIYKSSDGVNWIKASEFSTNLAETTGPAAVADMVFCNGNFIIGFSGSPYYLTNLFTSYIYTSPDLITWTSRFIPYYINPAGGFATDGTTVIAGTGYYIYKSTDGGITWTIIPSSIGTGVVIYSNGAWIIGQTTGNIMVTSDFITYYGSPGYTSYQLYQAYNSNNVITYYTIVGKSYVSAVSNGFNTNMTNPVGVSTTFSSTYKEIPIRSSDSVGLIASNYSIMTNPWYVLESPMYSYDTTTTFWIPPSIGELGQQTYIFGG